MKDDLILRIKLGDEQAFEMLFRKSYVHLWGFANKFLNDPEEAMEIPQKLFMQIWEGREDIDPENSFKSYLFTIAYNDICKLFWKRNYLQKYISDTLHKNSQSSSEIEESINYKSVMEQVLTLKLLKRMQSNLEEI